MIRYVVLSLIVTLAALFSADKVHSQVIMNRPGADTMKVVNLINADRLSYAKTNDTTELQMLSGNVQLKQGNTLFKCDSAILNKRTKYLEAFGNVHIVDNDTVNIRSQYLQYFTETKLAFLKNNVTLTDSKSTLYTNDLQYDLNTKVGEYHNGGRLVNQTSVLTSKEGTYYEELKDVYFKKNVDLKDPKYTLKTDSLLYNTSTQIATFIAPTKIVDSAKRTINTKDGFYDTRNRKAFFGQRPILKDGATTIIADNIDSDDSTGISILTGRAVYIDTAQGISVLANKINANRIDGSFLATQHPLLIIKQDKDSIYITADTLESGRLSKLRAQTDSTLPPDTNRLVRDTSFLKHDSLNLAKISISPVRDSLGLPKDSALLATDSSKLQTNIARADSTISLQKDTSVVKRDTIQKKNITKDIAPKPTLRNQPPAKKNAVKSVVAANNKPEKTTTENKNDSSDRYFKGWHHVRIFSDSMQAMSDSLWYSGKDSTFRLYTDPVMWASNSQITGDTIYVYTKNKNPDRLYVFENGLAINLSDKNMYNQIKGNRIHGYFKDGQIDYMRSQGNAESIYYLKEENGKLKGINNATGDIIDLRFKNKELNKVVFISDVSGTLYPVNQATEQNKFLRGFKWLEEKRPKTKFELFEDVKPVIKTDEQNETKGQQEQKQQEQPATKN
ncbi:LPS export ABC transporter periplasmic protein LptC [Niastella sp. OAS944]|uniref:LPS export ABC transporter periplasmic protein LptC n=1 Tax=Niastella sp. OAS944 TaxID=2664089 RepID=UPI00346C858A|nr:lipopolysaccharide export system protein LptA [Chitinophagaceae bacterium OAS944]